MSYTYTYPRPAMTADCVVVALKPTPHVLLIQRANEPFKDSWAFPGGFLEMDETIETCAKRELFEETGLNVDEITLIGVYSQVDRDPRGRTITAAYLSIVDSQIPVIGTDDAAQAKWLPLTELPSLAFDHNQILNDAKELLNKVI